MIWNRVVKLQNIVNNLSSGFTCLSHEIVEVHLRGSGHSQIYEEKKSNGLRFHHHNLIAERTICRKAMFGTYQDLISSNSVLQHYAQLDYITLNKMLVIKISRLVCHLLLIYDSISQSNFECLRLSWMVRKWCQEGSVIVVLLICICCHNSMIRSTTHPQHYVLFRWKKFTNQCMVCL